MHNLKDLARRYLWAMSYFNRKRGTTLAASSSFYLLLTLIPFTLLLIRAVGFVIGDISSTLDQLIILAEGLIPSLGPNIFIKAKKFIWGPLFGPAKFTFLNFILLSISSLSFINSIWSGLFLMTGDKKLLSWKNYFKGFVVIGFSILLIVFLFTIPAMAVSLMTKVQSWKFLDYLSNNIETLKPLVIYLKSINMAKWNFVKSDFLLSMFLTSYFTFLYYWLFRRKVSVRDCLIAAISFSVLVVLLKKVFWVYVHYVRESLITNYGDYYTLIVAIIWVFAVMNIFFYGASLCRMFQIRPLEFSSIKSE